MRLNNRSRRCLWERRQTGTPASGRQLWPEFPSGSNTCERTNKRTVIDEDILHYTVSGTLLME